MLGWFSSSVSWLRNFAISTSLNHRSAGVKGEGFLGQLKRWQLVWGGKIRKGKVGKLDCLSGRGSRKLVTSFVLFYFKRGLQWLKTRVETLSECLRFSVALRSVEKLPVTSLKTLKMSNLTRCIGVRAIKTIWVIQTVC